MKFSITLAEMKAVANKLDRVLKSNETALPILNSVKVVAEANETVQFTASNGVDTILVTVKVEGENSPLIVENSGMVCIPKNTLKVLEKFKNNTTPVTFEVVDNTLVLTQKRTKLTFLTFNAEEYPKFEPTTAPLASFPISFKLFNDIVSKSAYAAIKASDSRPILQGINFKFQLDENNQLAFQASATDSHRLSLYQSVLPLNPEAAILDFTVPAATLRDSVKIFNNADAIGITVFKNIVLINDTNTIVFFRLIEGNYPEVNRLIPAVNEKTKVIELDTAELFNTLEIVEALNTDVNDVVFQVSDQQLTVLSREVGGSTSKLKQEIPLTKSSAGELTFAASCSFIKESLKACATPTIRIQMEAPLKPVLFFPVYSDGAQVAAQISHLVLPVRTY